MITICSRCHLDGRHVEMTSSFLRYEKQVTDVPCEAYPDGTVVTERKQTADVPVVKFVCPACGLSVERRFGPELPSSPESP